ncbi:MAG: HAD family hydrolase [Candidatus Moranbacteria bacterium]|nr:HAD family hydrolase [Candidatus Moranbacteria bacterium]
MKLAVIFDFDGVIVDSYQIFKDAFLDACLESGYHQISTEEAFLNLFDGNLYESMEHTGISKEAIRIILKNFKENAHINHNKLRFFDGVREMLSKLAEKNKIFLVSSNLTSIVQDFLRFHKVTVFEEVLGSDKETSKVKKIEGIKANLSNYELLYVGDTKGDMVEGQLAGAKTVAVTWGWHSEERLREANPNFVVKTPSELALLVNNL